MPKKQTTPYPLPPNDFFLRNQNSVTGPYIYQKVCVLTFYLHIFRPILSNKCGFWKFQVLADTFDDFLATFYLSQIAI